MAYSTAMRTRLFPGSLLLFGGFLLFGFSCPGGPGVEATDGEPSIAEIQGRGHRSTYTGKRVTVYGVVTAVLDTRREHGFWIQAEPDDDDATSDAVFVSTGDSSPVVKEGSLVRVSGVVEEIEQRGELTTTTIAGPEVELVRSRGRLPRPVVLGHGGRPIPSTAIDDDSFGVFDPENDAIDFWESLEGMLVEVRDGVVVGPTSQYGDLVVIPDGGARVTARSVAGGLVVSDGNFHPERVHVSSTLNPGAPDLKVGDRFLEPISGIVDYRFGNFRVLNIERLPDARAGDFVSEETTLQASENQLTVATYNVLNLSARDEAKRFADLAETIVRSLRSPDIIALQEMQDESGADDDGVVGGAATFTRLIASIVTAGGVRYSYRQIDPENNADGGVPGGNIRVGYLYNAERVHFVDRGKSGPSDAVSVLNEGDQIQLSASPGRIEPQSPCFAAAREDSEGVRKSLVAEFRFDGRTVFVVNNHLSSKRGDNALFGAIQPPVLHSEKRRRCQADLIAGFVGDIINRHSGAWIVVLGDMNEHEFREPMRILVGAGLENLINRVPPPERYTYIYEGNSQILDNVFVSQAAANEGSPEIDIVHCNIDLPAPDAASDHDPIVIRLTFP